MKDDKVYIVHIMECIEDIERYTKKDRKRFMEDDMISNACLRQLQIMAESTQRLSSHVKSEITEIDWKKLAGFRNVMAHGYLGTINFELVWDVIEKRLPELKNALWKYKEKSKI